MRHDIAGRKVQSAGFLTLAEYKRVYCLADELGDRAEIDRLQGFYLIDNNGATPTAELQ